MPLRGSPSGSAATEVDGAAATAVGAPPPGPRRARRATTATAAAPDARRARPRVGRDEPARGPPAAGPGVVGASCRRGRGVDDRARTRREPPAPDRTSAMRPLAVAGRTSSGAAANRASGERRVRRRSAQASQRSAWSPITLAAGPSKAVTPSSRQLGPEEGAGGCPAIPQHRRPHRLPQADAQPVEHLVGGTGGDVQLGRDLRRTESVPEVELQEAGVARGQRGRGRPQEGGGLGPLDGRGRIVGDGGLGAGTTHAHGVPRRQAAPVPPEPVEGPVAGDAQEPAPEGQRVLQRGQAPPRHLERVLGDVGGDVAGRARCAGPGRARGRPSGRTARRTPRRRPAWAASTTARSSTPRGAAGPGPGVADSGGEGRRGGHGGHRAGDRRPREASTRPRGPLPPPLVSGRRRPVVRTVTNHETRRAPPP